MQSLRGSLGQADDLPSYLAVTESCSVLVTFHLKYLDKPPWRWPHALTGRQSLWHWALPQAGVVHLPALHRQDKQASRQPSCLLCCRDQHSSASPMRACACSCTFPPPCALWLTCGAAAAGLRRGCGCSSACPTPTRRCPAYCPAASWPPCPLWLLPASSSMVAASSSCCAGTLHTQQPPPPGAVQRLHSSLYVELVPLQDLDCVTAQHVLSAQPLLSKRILLVRGPAHRLDSLPTGYAGIPDCRYLQQA